MNKTQDRIEELSTSDGAVEPGSSEVSPRLRPKR